MPPPDAAAHEHAANVVTPQAILDGIIEVTLDAICICDAAGKVTTWNSTAERLFGRMMGRSRDSVVGESP
jgi:PAS domain-containing protein